jgi:AcrR family transcriptional regulator
VTATARRERERAQRHQMIITAARELAEAEGWDAVTTRRLAERIEYSQPVLYSHFAGKDAIVAAVAIEGFAELADCLRRARLGADGPGAARRAIFHPYRAFAPARPALYQAMFVMPIDVKFASDEETPAPLRASFAELVSMLPPETKHPQLTTEVIWSALHGIAVFEASSPRRLLADREDERVEILAAFITGRPLSG